MSRRTIIIASGTPAKKKSNLEHTIAVIVAWAVIFFCMIKFFDSDAYLREVESRESRSDR